MKIQTDNFMTGDPAFAVNRRGVISYWNAAAELSLGHLRSEAIGKKCWELLCGQDSNGNRYCVRHCPLREMAFRHEPVHGFQVSFVTASYQHREYSIGCVVVFDETGEEMLLHICHPENECMETAGYQTPVDHQIPAEVHTESLSQREIEVLSLLAEKVSTKDIAVRMGISIRTVRTHIQHMMYKLQVHKRHDAIETANRLNLI